MTMQRITKPTPKRTRPVRNISGAVRANGNGKSRAKPTEPAIAQGVQLGYQLVEEYLDAGRAAAASLRESSPRGSAELTDSERLAQRLVRYTSEFASVGLELLQAFTKPAPQPPPSGTAGPFAVPHVEPPPQPSAASAPARFELEIDTQRPVRVSLELDPQVSLGALIAHDLRCSQPEARIRPLELAYDPKAQRVSARLQIPEAAPAGEYNALLVDPTDNLPRGRLSLRVES
ncbi:MAG TPA: hypothetical protein VJV78_41735 [Polyangiales bacterium]|nr:hypothetical protein [Polyangiales bacterium]